MSCKSNYSAGRWKIILVGNYDNNYYTDPAIARFNEDGTIDTTFGVDGLVKFDLSAQFDDFNDVVVQPDGKIVVAGSSYKYGTDDFYWCDLMKMDQLIIRLV